MASRKKISILEFISHGIEWDYLSGPLDMDRAERGYIHLRTVAVYGGNPFLNVVIIGMAAVENSQNEISGSSIGFVIDCEIKIMILQLILIRFQ